MDASTTTMLTELKTSELKEICSGPSSAARDAAEELAKRASDPEAASALHALSSHANEWTRLYVIEAIPKSTTKLPVIIDILRRATLDANASVRSEAAKSAVELNAEELADDIEQLLGDSEWVVRADAAEALGNLGYTKAVDRLLTLAESDPCDTVRLYAALAIGITGQHSALDKIVELSVTEADDDVRAELLCSAYRLGETSALDRLVKTIRNADDESLDHMATLLEDLVIHRPPAHLVQHGGRLSSEIAALKLSSDSIRARIDNIGAVLQKLASSAGESTGAQRDDT